VDEKNEFDLVAGHDGSGDASSSVGRGCHLPTKDTGYYYCTKNIGVGVPDGFLVYNHAGTTTHRGSGGPSSSVFQTRDIGRSKNIGVGESVTIKTQLVQHVCNGHLALKDRSTDVTFATYRTNALNDGFVVLLCPYFANNHGLGGTERRRKRFALDRELLLGSDFLGFGLHQDELIEGFPTNGGGTAAGPRTGKATVETMVGSGTVAAGLCSAIAACARRR
jgi:hypothetical protein